MESKKDRSYMKRALSLAIRGGGYVNPNPQVGAVIVADGKVVGEGFHEQFGEPHAEINALEEAGEKAEKATMYVSLEPCNHQGKTPPCTEAIIESGISEVYVATEDPNPDVAGCGIEKLRAAGIEVHSGLLEKEAKEVNEIYFHYVETGKPFVLLKLAMSLDGKIATKTGDSRWITSKASREFVHELRARYSAVGVGVNTVISDDPRLNVRNADGPDGTRFVFDVEAKTPPDSRLLNLESASPTIIVTSGTAPRERMEGLEQSGARVWRFPEKGQGVDLKAFLSRMGNEGYDSLMVEGGGELAWNFLAPDLVDRVQLFYSPILIGGRQAVPSVGGEGVDSVKEALQLEDVTVARMGKDIIVSGYPVKE